MEMQNPRGRSLGYLEGDESIYIDGETIASIRGTGTEDYFNSGWYFIRGPYSAPYHGVTIKDEQAARINAYRWHIEDPIPFQKSLRFTLEHGGTNDAPGMDYASVAYWYQTQPHAHFPPLPADLMPTPPAVIPHIAGIIEAESLVPTAKATEGAVSNQDVSTLDGEWSGGAQLFWEPKAAGAKLTLKLNAPAAKEYEVIGYFTQATDYATIRVSANGKGGRDFVGYAPAVRPSGAVSLGRVLLQSGPNDVVIEVIGKDAHSSGYYVGIDGFVLK